MEVDIEYDIDALKRNLKRCDDNIQTFKDAIAKEENTKLDLRRMILALEEKKLAEAKSRETRPTKEQREKMAKGLR